MQSRPSFRAPVSSIFVDQHVGTPRSGSSTTSLQSAAALVAIDSFWRSFPYVAAAITCGVKASAADFVAQRRQLKKRDDSATVASSETEESSSSSKKIDLRRNIAYILYGSLYQGMAQEFIYNHLYPRVFGAGSSPSVVVAKVLFDSAVQTVFVTLPLAYTAKAIIFKYSFKEAMRRYIDDIKNHGLLKKYWSLWAPVNLFVFSIVPVHWRVSTMAFVSFFWLIILSSIASRQRPAPAPKPLVSFDEDDDAVDLGTEDVEDCILVDGQTCNIDG